MKDYILISNTTENKDIDFYLDYVSSQLKKLTNEKIFCKELSPGKAYEWELSANKYNPKLKKIMFDFQKNHEFDCNFITSVTNRKKKITYC